jgi:hypothetical protein
MVQFRIIMRSTSPCGKVIEAVMAGLDWQDCNPLNKAVTDGMLFAKGTILQRRHPDGMIVESFIEHEDDFSKWSGDNKEKWK